MSDRNPSDDPLDASECDLCLETPRDPRFLPCGHVVCLRCLQKDHAEATRRGLYKADVVQCPECNKMSYVPGGGLEEFARDRRNLELGQLFKDRTVGSTLASKNLAKPKPQIVRSVSASSLTEHVHRLIQGIQSEAVAFLETLTAKNRFRVVSALEHGQNALTTAVQENALEVLVYLLDRCHADLTQESEATLTLVHRTESTRFPALTYAALYGNVEAAKILVEHGANINGANREGITPLFIASEEGHLDTVVYLVEAGAKVDVHDDLQVTSLMNASEQPEIREYLLSKGANVNKTNKEGFSALHYAAGEGCVESVRILVQYRADLSPQNKYGNTPLHDAAYKGHMDVVKALLVAGAEHSLCNGFGNTPLHFAVHKDNKAVVQLLLNQGADPYARNHRQEDCFLMAVLENKLDILRLLTSKHVNTFYNVNK